MNAPIRMFFLMAFLYHAWAQSSESWRGKTSEDRELVISVVKGAVTSLSVRMGISCLTAVEEGAKVFTGAPVPIAGNTIRFSGQTTTLCGAVQVRLDGTIEGTKASGNLTVIPPKQADNPAKKKLTWKAEKT